eukprot:sb/3475584/
MSVPHPLLPLLPSPGQYDASLHVAPELYSSTNHKLTSPVASEQIYVYCLGMTIYSASDYNNEDNELKKVTSYYILSKLCDRDHLATITLVTCTCNYERDLEISLPVAVGYQGEIQFCTCILLLLS